MTLHLCYSHMEKPKSQNWWLSRVCISATAICRNTKAEINHRSKSYHVMKINQIVFQSSQVIMKTSDFASWIQHSRYPYLASSSNTVIYSCIYRKIYAIWELNWMTEPELIMCYLVWFSTHRISRESQNQPFISTRIASYKVSTSGRTYSHPLFSDA